MVAVNWSHIFVDVDPSLICWCYPTFAREFQGFTVWGKFVFGKLELTATPTNLANQGQIRSRSWPITQCPIAQTCRHRKNFWAFTGPRIHFGLILLISNRIIHRSFTGPAHLLSANVRGLVSFAVSDLRECTKTVRSWGVRWEQIANFLDSFERIEWLYLLFKCGIKTKSILNGFLTLTFTLSVELRTHSA